MKILNLKTATPAEIKRSKRIDRATRWGNPYPMQNQSDEERERVIELYRQHLKKEIRAGRITREELAELHGRDLICWCSPKRCHGEVLQAAAKWAYDSLR